MHRTRRTLLDRRGNAQGPLAIEIEEVDVHDVSRKEPPEIPVFTVPDAAKHLLVASDRCGSAL
jgi:hypothetical protein